MGRFTLQRHLSAGATPAAPAPVQRGARRARRGPRRRGGQWLDALWAEVEEMGLPLALGAAIACPGRKTVCLHGDGGAMYTIQALWTMAREKTDVVTVIFANRSYAILKIELMRTGVQNAGPQALSLFDLANPEISFAGLARSMGVEGIRAETVEEFEAAFSSAMKRKGPVLIEAVI